jgi:hypothetical protein
MMPTKSVTIASLASLCVSAACSGPTQQATTSATSATATATAAPATAAKPKFPPEARRKTPPTGIETSALQVGALVPELVVPDDRGGTLRIGGLAPRPTLLLFYRGHW